MSSRGAREDVVSENALFGGFMNARFACAKRDYKKRRITTGVSFYLQVRNRARAQHDNRQPDEPYDLTHPKKTP